MSALAEALLAAQSELPTAIPRDAQGQGYRYLTLDALIAATRPILNRHGLTITQWPTTIPRGESCVPGLTTRIEHQSQGVYPLAEYEIFYEDAREYTMPLYLSEPKNMQALGAAITYARRRIEGLRLEQDRRARAESPLMCACDVAYTCPRCLSREESSERVEVDEAERDRINTASDTTKETE